MARRGMFRALGAAGVLLAMSGCGQITADSEFEVENANARSRQAARDFQSRESIRPGAAQVSDSFFVAPVDGRVRAENLLPPQLRKVNAVSIVSREPLSLADIAARLTRITGVPHIVALGPTGTRVTSTQDGATETQTLTESGGGFGQDATSSDTTAIQSGATNIASGGGSTRSANMRIRPNLTGSLGDVLNSLSDAFEVEWSVEEGRVLFRDYVTRQYQVSSLPVTSSSSTSVSGTSSSASLDVWDEVSSTLENLTGEGTRITIGQGTGIITVTALVQDQSRIYNYLSTLNDALGQQIAFDVNILNVSLSQSEGFSLDITEVLYQASNGNFALTKTTTPSLGNENTGFGPFNVFIAGNDFELNALIDALSQTGDVTVETRTGSTTTNFQTVPVEVVDETAYVAQINTVLNDGGNNIGSTVVPGTITTGLQMRLQPRVLNTREILLRYALELSDLIQLEDFPTDGGTIQLPEVSRVNFEQQVILRNGQTLVLAGFERKRTAVNKQGVGAAGFFGLGGSRGATNERASSVVLITPRLLSRVSNSR